MSDGLPEQREVAEVTGKADEGVAKPVINSGGGVLKMVLEMIKSGMTEQEVAVALGLPTGWIVSPKEASRQVHFIAADGKRSRSVRELGRALGWLPAFLSATGQDGQDKTLRAAPQKKAEAPTDCSDSSNPKRTRKSQLEKVGDKAVLKSVAETGEQIGTTPATAHLQQVSMLGAAQAALDKNKTDAEVANALGLPEGWKVTVDRTARAVFFHPPGRRRIRGAAQLAALLGEIPEALGGAQRHSRSSFDESVYIAVRDYIMANPTSWSLSLMIQELSELHGWSRETSAKDEALKNIVKAAISRCGLGSMSAAAIFQQ